MKDNQGGGLTEVRGGLLGLLDVLACVGCEPWCSKVPCRSPVAVIYQWAATRTGTIGGPERTRVGLHTFHARPVRTALRYCDRLHVRWSRQAPFSWGDLVDGVIDGVIDGVWPSSKLIIWTWFLVPSSYLKKGFRCVFFTQ